MENKRLVMIGSSGSGLPILNSIFMNMPRLRGPVVLIQHMPEYINQNVVHHLAAKTRMTVQLARTDVTLQSGTLYVAPSELHFRLTGNNRIVLQAGDRVNFVCPSIDVAMQSIAAEPRVEAMGILLSGVGDDGVKGLNHIRKLGGTTIALERSSAAIPGMTEEALAAGAVDLVLNPEQIRTTLMEYLRWDPAQ
jgi:two-component system, chemotaxis family, protein-glutamate methylesterase/glutaminase